MKNKLNIILVVIASMIIVLGCDEGDYKNDKGESLQNIEAGRLLGEYDTHRAHYDNSLLRVEYGWVSSVNVSGGEIMIHGDIKKWNSERDYKDKTWASESMVLKCKSNESETPKLLNLKPGDKIIIYGLCKGRIGNEVTIENCQIEDKPLEDKPPE